jgi:hypothetical protein
VNAGVSQRPGALRFKVSFLLRHRLKQSCAQCPSDQLSRRTFLGWLLRRKTAAHFNSPCHRLHRPANLRLAVVTEAAAATTMAHVATVAPLTDASVPELKPLSSSDELAVEPQDVEEADGLLLHLIRTIALYLFVLLSQTAKLAVADAELVGFVSDAATPDLLDAQTAALQRRLHLALFAWVQGEVNSNQFDGLLQEQRAFVVIKRLFRQQHTKAAAQCRVLAALLTSYLARLETPLVQCEPSSMLSSTLEYLLAKEANSASKEPVPLPMLYPLVNAVDLVSIEQRECLDALMNLLRWLTAHDETKTVSLKPVADSGVGTLY